MKRYFALLLAALLLGAPGARAQGPDDQYVRIYNVLQEADMLNTGTTLSESLAKYQEAQTGLQRFQRSFPDWNPKVVSFRLDYIAGRIAALSAKLPAPAANPPAAKTVPAETPESLRLGLELGEAQGQVRQLQADKSLLEAKLKESLSAQPAAMDPRELARAEEKVKLLQKENDLLQVSLAQEKSKAAAPAGDAKALAEAQQALAEANRKLAEQTRKAGAWAQEKQFLQNKLSVLAPGQENAAVLEKTKKALEDANRQLAQQKELAARLAAEKETLQSRVKSLGADSEAAAALRAENAQLKKQLAGTKTAPPLRTKPADVAQQLAQAQAELAALQAEKDILQFQKAALENRVKTLNATQVTNSIVIAPFNSEDTARIKQLEKEREALRKKLETANKELASRTKRGAAARAAELEREVVTLRARLDTLEAKSVPFTEEELALFSKPGTKLAEAESKPAEASARKTSATTLALATDARRYFSSGQMDKAEEAFVQVLQQSQPDVLTLANLATVQLERNRLEEAEATIRQALALAPDDACSLSILGYVKFRQKKYDDALNTLSRAAKIDPQNAQVQNYLGITLSEKGLRGPAETAFRKAIEIEPRYGDAHINLAVLYIGQKPPAAELARWHYQKALAAGHARSEPLERMFEAKK